MTKARSVFAVHPEEILKTEFRIRWARAGMLWRRRLIFLAYEVVRGE
jgi:hypothetical protein